MLCDDYYNSIRLYRTHFNMQPRLKEAVKDHRRIIEALEERDAELAEILTRRGAIILKDPSAYTWDFLFFYIVFRKIPHEQPFSSEKTPTGQYRLGDWLCL